MRGLRMRAAMLPRLRGCCGAAAVTRMQYECTPGARAWTRPVPRGEKAGSTGCWPRAPARKARRPPGQAVCQTTPAVPDRESAATGVPRCAPGPGATRAVDPASVAAGRRPAAEPPPAGPAKQGWAAGLAGASSGAGARVVPARRGRFAAPTSHITGRPRCRRRTAPEPRCHLHGSLRITGGPRFVRAEVTRPNAGRESVPLVVRARSPGRGGRRLLEQLAKLGVARALPLHLFPDRAVRVPEDRGLAAFDVAGGRST